MKKLFSIILLVCLIITMFCFNGKAKAEDNSIIITVSSDYKKITLEYPSQVLGDNVQYSLNGDKTEAIYSYRNSYMSTIDIKNEWYDNNLIVSLLNDGHTIIETSIKIPSLNPNLSNQHTFSFSITTEDGKEVYFYPRNINGINYYFLPSGVDLAKAKVYSDIELISAKSALAPINETKIQNGVFFDLSSLQGFANCEANFVEFSHADGSFVIAYMKSNNVSSVFYDTDDPANFGREYIESLRDHSLKSTGNVTLYDESFTEVFNGKVSAFKGRGNMTWDAQKKPYQIKLDKKADLLDPANGKQKAKKWLLISSPFDGTMLLNEFIYAMAHRMGMSETPEGKPVDFYYDGEYRGTYYLCEKVEIGTGRLEIDDLEKDIEDANPDIDFEALPVATGKNKYGEKIQYVTGINNPEDISGGYLLELDNLFYKTELSYFITNNNRPIYVSKQPEYLSKDAIIYISEFMHDYYKSITDGGVNNSTGKKFTDYLDLNSAVKYYTIQQFTKNNDAFNTSTFFYKPKGENKIYAGPLWDCDATMGHRLKTEDPTGILDQGRMDSEWMKISEFRNAFYQYFKDEFREIIEEMIINRDGINTWYSHANNLDKTTAMNFTVWEPESNDSFFNWPERWQNLTDQYNWLLTRISWFDQKLKSIDITRLYGDNRYKTSLKVADTLKQIKGIEKFDKIILADGNQFPDALCSGFLAQSLDAPIILINNTNSKMVTDYINSNLNSDGSIIILGGENAISASLLSNLNNKYERVYGNNRYETNLEILNYLDVKYDTLLVCSGNNYPDSLSVSALNLPIMLVNNELRSDQIDYLSKNEFAEICIIGGTSAVNTKIESSLKTYSSVKRIAGSNRFQTSTCVAKEFFGKTDNALISFARNFPDGLCGGPLAGVINAPVLLTADGNTDELKKYFNEFTYPNKLYILGGESLISNNSIIKLFDTFIKQKIKSDKY